MTPIWNDDQIQARVLFEVTFSLVLLSVNKEIIPEATGARPIKRPTGPIVAHETRAVIAPMAICTAALTISPVD